MSTQVALGSREAPIVLDDDEDDDDEVVCLGVSCPPKLPQHAALTPNGHSPERPVVLDSTTDTDGIGADYVVIDDDDDQGPPEPLPSLDRTSPPSVSGQHSQSLIGLSHPEIGLASSPHPVDTPGNHSLKRKRSEEDAGDQDLSRSAKTSPNSLSSITPELADGLTRTEMARFRKAPKAEQDVTLGPDQVSYRGPLWPSHIQKGCTIPKPGFGFLEAGGRHSRLSNTRLSRNNFGQPDRAIGKYTGSVVERGRFPSDESHDPAHTLILEVAPKRFRTLDFVLQWCRDVSLLDDSAPLCIIVNRRLGKALVEFATPEQAGRAFDSPRMTNTDGRTQIAAVWYCTPDGVCHASSKQRSRITTYGQSTFPETPGWDSSFSHELLDPLRIGLPFQPTGFVPFVPFSQTILPFYPAPVPQPFATFPHHAVQHIEQMASMHPFAMSNSLSLQKRDPDAEMSDDDEVEEQLRLQRGGFSTQGSPRDRVVEPLSGSWQPTGQNSSITGDAFDPEKLCSGGVSKTPNFSPLAHGHRQDFISPHTETCGGTSSCRDDPRVVRVDVEKEQIRQGEKEPREFPSDADNRAFSLEKPSRSSGIATQFDEKKDSHPPPGRAPEPNAIALLSLSLVEGNMVPKEEGEVTPSDLDVDQPDLSAKLPPQDGSYSDKESERIIKDNTSPKAAEESEKKLAELRDRVLASRKRKMLEIATTASPFVPASISIVASSSTNYTPPCETLTSFASSTSPSSTELSLSSSSTPASSNSEGSDSRASSYFDRMASSFLEGVLGPLKSGVQTISDAEVQVSSRIPVHRDKTVLLREKQRRLEEHLATSRRLLGQWEVAQGKPEKARVMKLIKDEKSKFEEEQAAADAELKQLETRRAMKPEFAPRRPLFRCWPQTQKDQLVIALSDEEDDE